MVRRIAAGENASPRPDPPPPAPVRVFQAPTRAVGMLATVRGVGGCVAVAEDRGSGRDPVSRPSVVLWPPGVTADREGVRGPGPGLIRYGQGVQGSGGGFGWPVVDPGLPAIPRDCWGTGEEPGGITVVNPGFLMTDGRLGGR